MKLSPSWLREFVDLRVDHRQLADDLTLAGIAVESVSGEGDATVFEMEITTNRPDAMNHYGVARECSALYDLPLRPIVAKLPAAAKAAPPARPGGTAEAVPFHGSSQGSGEGGLSPSGDAGRVRVASGGTTDSAPAAAKAAPPATASLRAAASAKVARAGKPFVIEIASPDGCARYTARIVRGVSVKPSPEPISRRLMSVDQRPINNIADASNYTLWEMGHPTHAFDLDLLEGGKILVRRAFSGETLKTLDGVERKLSPEDLVIADAVKPVALAGVMGGFDTMITEKTKNVLIEAAWFDPVMVRKSSRRHGLHTDASHRFERGADFGATALACARVAQRILESGGGELEGEAIDAVARRLDQAPVGLRLSEVRRILGKSLEANEVVKILQHLGFELMPEPGEQIEFLVQIPSWRLDIEREIDLIEEVARLHGYDKFANTLPSFAGAVMEQPDAEKDRNLRSNLLALGYNETVSLSFISHADAARFSTVPVIELENPLSEEAAVMRTSLVPGMLGMLAGNLNRGNENVRLFESGNVFGRDGNQAREVKNICLGLTGNVAPPGSYQPARAVSFFDLKGDVEELLRQFDHKSLYFDAHTAEHYYRGRSARAVMDGATVAQFGEIDPAIAAERKLRQEVLVGEIYLERLHQHALRKAHYQPIPKYPAVRRDFSFIFDDRVVFERIAKAVTSLAVPELREIVPVEIFRGGSIPAGKYSLLLRATFQSSEKTLREEEIAQWSSGIIRTLEALGGKLRG